MVKNQSVFEFAEKWQKIFSDPSTQEREIDYTFGEACRELEFEMDCGHEFCKRLGSEAFQSDTGLEKAIDRIKDITVLGSGIYSKWRYVSYWLQRDLLEAENRKWFSLALDRLRVLAESESDL